MLEFIILALVFFGIGQFLKTYVLANEEVQGPSMQPTFETGDRIIAYRHGKVERGDVIVLKAPDEPGAYYIKRVIGMPGDTVSSKNDTTYINGKKYSEPYLTAYKKKLTPGTLYTTNFTLKSLGMGNKVPKGEYFVMGDHRDVSKDSRMIGYIPKDSVVGVVKLRYWPISDLRTF
nr:signal peptidase I [Agrilactobacillus yilanensis]